jgi:O-antigen ligase
MTTARQSPGLAWLAALAALPFLAWKGGLLGWQPLLAALAVLGASLANGSFLPGIWRRGLAVVAAASAISIFVSIQPQASLNAWAGVAAGILLLAALSAQPAEAGWPVAATLWLALVSAALFMGWGWILGGELEPMNKVGPFSWPHLSVRFLFPNQNLLAGGILAPALLMSLARLSRSRRDVLAWTAGGVALAGIVYSGSKGALLGLAAGGLWVFLRGPGSRKALLLGGAALALGLVLLPFSRLAQRLYQRMAPPPPSQQRQFNLQDGNEFKRLEFWRASFLLSARRPWAGWGLGAYADAATRADLPTALTVRQPIARYRLRLDHAHNEILESLVELGWPATLLLLALAAAFFRWRFSAAGDPDSVGLEGALLILLGLGLVDMPFRCPALLWLGLLWLAPLLPTGKSDGKARGMAPVLAAVIALLALGRWKQWLPLQPLDPRLAAVQLRAGNPVPAWSAWCGREEPQWWLAESQRLAGAGDFDGAFKATAKAVALQPFSAPRWLLLAKRAHALRRPNERNLALARALELEPNFAGAWEMRARWAESPLEKKAALRALSDIKKLEVLIEESDPYTTQLKAADWGWIAKQN